MRLGINRSVFLAIVFIALVFSGRAFAPQPLQTFPDYDTCADTIDLQFPDVVTMGTDRLVVAHCPTPDFNAGDFVTVLIRDFQGNFIESISRFSETAIGFEWISPTSDDHGRAWETVHIVPEVYDCNRTGADYNLEVSWDAERMGKPFKIVCPVLTLDRYRTTVNFGEALNIDVKVKDNLGNRMVGVPCRGWLSYMRLQTSETEIIQNQAEVFSDGSGTAHFEYATGLTSGLLINYDYNFFAECYGGDVNYTFSITQPDSQNIRNPVFYFFVWTADNIVPIFLMLIILVTIVGAAYFTFRVE